MSQPSQTYIATRRMDKSDLEQVIKIEKECFTHNTHIETHLKKTKSNYLVAYLTTEHFDTLMVQGESSHPVNFMPIDLTKTTIHIDEYDRKSIIAGYLGWSNLAGQAHIISIAVASCLRGHKIGILLLSTAIQMATSASMMDVTLEVRSSNTVAINLYDKLGFTLRGTRKDYYNDNLEDALIMTTPSIGDVDYQKFITKLKDRLGIQSCLGTK